MNTNSPEDASTLHDEVAEELALRAALKRTKLEQAAANLGLSLNRWTIYIIVGGVLFYFRDDLADYLWAIIAFLLLEIQASTSSVHSRIDAILELDELKHSDQTNVKSNHEITDHR